ncbi:unnamed protein product, partial [Symbiodinium sp. CCMP2592]
MASDSDSSSSSSASSASPSAARKAQQTQASKKRKAAEARMLPILDTGGCSDAASTEGDEKCIAWGKYRKVQSASGVVRVPVGASDGICRNVYRLLGFPHKYGSQAEYLKKVEAKQVDHDEFLKSRAEYVKKMKKGGQAGARTKKREKEDLKTASTLKTVKDTGVRFEGPLMQFIDITQWDAKEDGVLDETKIVEEAGFLSQEINGETVKGIYKMRGRRGCYDVRNFDTKKARTETEEHSKKDSKAMFADQALANKKVAIQAAFTETHQERVSKAVEAAPTSYDAEGILALLQSSVLGGNATAASGLAKPADNDQKESDGSDESNAELDESSSESDDEGKAQERLQSLAGKKKAKAKSQPKAAPKASTAKAGPTRSTVSVSLPPVEKTQSQQPSKASAPSQPAKKPSSDDFGAVASPAKTLNLDGRGMRLKDSLKKELAELKLKFEGQLGFGNDYNFLDKKEHAARQRSLTGVSNSVQNSMRRIENSPNKVSFESEIEGFESLRSLVQHALDLNTALASTTGGPKAIEDLYECLKENGLIRVGSCFWFKLLECKLNEKILFKNLSDYVGVLCEDSKEVCALNDLGVSDNVREFVHADVESRMTTFLGKEDVLKDGSWGRNQARNLASEVCDQKSNSLFENVIFTCELTRDLLADDISGMASALERFAKVAEEDVLEDG